MNEAHTVQAVCRQTWSLTVRHDSCWWEHTFDRNRRGRSRQVQMRQLTQQWVQPKTCILFPKFEVVITSWRCWRQVISNYRLKVTNKST